MIEELTLRGFKSFRYSQTIKFSQGVNKISGRNAAGKTTILEAIIYGLFGEVPGVNKRELVTIGANSLSVLVKFRSPLTGIKAKVLREGVNSRDKKTGDLRFRSTKNILEVENQAPVTKISDIQEKLRELFGIGRNTFLNVVYAKQKEFIDIVRPRDEKRMDAMLGLTTPSEIREQLRETRKQLESRGRIHEKNAIVERIHNASSIINESNSQLEDLEKREIKLNQGLNELRAKNKQISLDLNSFELLLDEYHNIEKRLQQLQENRAIKQTYVDNLEKIYGSFDEDPDKLIKILDMRYNSATSTEKRLQKLIQQTLNVKQRKIDTSISQLNHNITKHTQFSKQGLSICPQCGQEINYKLIEKEISLWREELTKKQRSLRALEDEIKTVQDQVNQARIKGDNARDHLTRVKAQMKQIEDLKSGIKIFDAKAEKLNHRIEEETKKFLERAEALLMKNFADLILAKNQIEVDIDVLRKTNNKFARELGDREGELRGLIRQKNELNRRRERQQELLVESHKVFAMIQEYETKIKVLEAIIERYSIYEKELRENTIRLLEYRTYEYFQRLTDQQIYSSCHIDREKYVLEVQPIGSPRPIPAWRAGGGHESLFALAERLALLRVMDFPHLLILDEPTDAVDSENIPQLLDYIAKTSTEISQVLLVTHHGYGEEQGVNLIQVSKKIQQSNIQQEF
jgi:DNA repair exonuclease SbcCD ATPase subunit